MAVFYTKCEAYSGEQQSSFLSVILSLSYKACLEQLGFPYTVVTKMTKNECFDWLIWRLLGVPIL